MPPVKLKAMVMQAKGIESTGIQARGMDQGAIALPQSPPRLNWVDRCSDRQRLGGLRRWGGWLFWVAVGLHGVFLALPLPDRSPHSATTEPSPPGVPLAVVSLESLLQSPPQPALLHASPVPSVPVPPVGSLEEGSLDAGPPPEPPLNPEPAIAAPVANPPVAPDPLSFTPISPEPPPTSEPALEPPSNEAPLPGLSGFLSALQTQSGHLPETIPTASPADFAHPEFFFMSDLATGAILPQWKPGILRTTLIPNQSPSQTYITMLLSAQDRGFQNSQRSDYGGGSVYEVSQNGETWYFNLIATADHQGTLIVIWEQAP